MSTITIPLATFDAMRETLEDLAAIFRLDQDTVKTSYGVCNSDRDAIHAALTAANAVSAEECTCQAKEMPFGRCCKAVQSEAIPAGMKLVPIEPTPEIIAAAAVAVWPVASAADIELAHKATLIVMMQMDTPPRDDRRHARRSAGNDGAFLPRHARSARRCSMSAISSLRAAIELALDEAPVSEVLSILTGAFVGLTVELVSRQDHDASKEIKVDGGKQRDITIHSEKATP